MGRVFVKEQTEIKTPSLDLNIDAIINAALVAATILCFLYILRLKLKRD
jgi:hypothetical protein